MAVISNDQRLDGWKAIANFLGRERSTAIRWANERGLPVHRVPGGRTGTIYAVQSELEAWLASERDDVEAVARPASPASPQPPPPTPTPTTTTGHTVGRRTLAAAVAAAILVTILIVTVWRARQSTDSAVSVAAVTSSAASADTLEFARGLNADLARFANASPDVAIFERAPGVAPETEYAVQTEIERAGGKMIAKSRLIAVPRGEVIWSRRFEQSDPALSALREQVAANIVNALRCSFGALEGERPKATPSDVARLMAICDLFQEGDFAQAQTRARQLTLAHPELALGWAMLALVQGSMVDEGRPEMQSQALANSRRALAIAPDNVTTWLARAAASGEGPTSPRALPIIDEALRRHPDMPWLLNNRSVILFNLGYVQASVADAVNAVRNDPSSFLGRDVAVRRLAAAGRTREALQMQSENERLWPGHPQVIANRARITAKDLVPDAAIASEIRDTERDFATMPTNAYRLAHLYERRGNRAAALAWLARAPVGNALQQWSQLFWPDAAGLRTEPAFFRKMADLALVHWWIARREWPDFCTEPGLKYSCADAARKLAAMARRPAALKPPPAPPPPRREAAPPAP